MAVEELVFEVTEALRVPVLVLALGALVLSVVELGRLVGELVRRRPRDLGRLDAHLDEARALLGRDDADGARRTLRAVAFTPGMGRVVDALVAVHGRPDRADRAAKHLAEFDLAALRALERTRVLVRFGPALGLMGTLIPLSPALAGLSDGDVGTLTENLRVAFGITVLGLLVGAVAFGVSLLRDRLYAHDYSDLEYIAARLAAPAAA